MSSRLRMIFHSLAKIANSESLLSLQRKKVAFLIKIIYNIIMGEIRKNQQVKLIFKTVDGSEIELDCKVNNFDHDRVYLDFSEELLEYSDYLQEGDEIKVKIFTPLGIKVFDALVINSPLENEFVIEYVENSVQIQRREFLRVPFALKMVIQGIGRKNVAVNTIDLSGGGARFFSNEKFYVEETVKSTIYLPDERAVKADGFITTNEGLPKGQFVLTFTQIDEKERNRIIKKCFEVQLELTKSEEEV